MPIPLLVIGAAAGAVSLSMTAHSALKQRKWKKVHDERLAEFQAVQEEAKRIHRQMEAAGESRGRSNVRASNTLKQAAEYLQGIAKELELESLPEIPSEALKEWVDLQSQIAMSLGVGVAGATASGAVATAPSAIYAAAGLFGVASTGTRIAGLTGAAANSARLAWIGGGALATGGGGIAMGSTILNVLSKANVVTAPIGLAAGIWSEKKAHDFEKDVTNKVREFAAVEEKLLKRKIPAMRSVTKRTGEREQATREANTALQNLLRKAKVLPTDPRLPSPAWAYLGIPMEVQVDLQIAHQIYLTAKALRQLLEEPTISNDDRRIIEG